MEKEILAEREISGMSSTWDEFLCICKTSEQIVTLFNGRREILAEHSSFYDELAEEYVVPEKINGRVVYGVKDGNVVGVDIERYHDDPSLVIRDNDESTVIWLIKNRWDDYVTPEEVCSAINAFKEKY